MGQTHTLAQGCQLVSWSDQDGYDLPVRHCLPDLRTGRAKLVLHLSSSGFVMAPRPVLLFVCPCCRFAVSVFLLYVAAVIYYLYVRIALTLDMKDRW